MSRCSVASDDHKRHLIEKRLKLFVSVKLSVAFGKAIYFKLLQAKSYWKKNKMSRLKFRSLFLTLLLIATPCRGHLLDFGKCACSCRGDDQDEANAVPFSGPKGDIGPPGKQGPPGDRGAGAVWGSAENPGQTCSQLFANGVHDDGVYFIKPDRFSSMYPVYCDMESAGGPFTLVASVHENNPRGMCTVGDKWSSEQGNGKYVHSERNWENTNIFGDVQSATSDDYKSPAYFHLRARNIMIWHVPNNTPASKYKNKARLMYKTNNDFVSTQGGNLRSLFKNRFPMKQIKQDRTIFEINNLVQATRKIGAQLTAAIPNWNPYVYDDLDKKAIFDGQNDIFDTGNQLYFAVNEGEFQQITYEEKYTQDGVALNTSTGYPFFMYLWVDGPLDKLMFKVDSELGADGEGQIVTYSGTFDQGRFNVAYKAQHVYGATDPSIMQAYFVISSQQAWGSETSPILTPIWSTNTGFLNHQVRLGPVKNIMFGYTLLSKNNATHITEAELIAVLKLFQGSVSTEMPTYKTARCSQLNESVAVPIEFIRGGRGEVLSHIPGKFRGEVDAGFLHFRAVGKSGNPSALCPGIRSRSCANDVFCVGGIQGGEGSPCGDFPNWSNSPSQEALESSILIFYDDQ